MANEQNLKRFGHEKQTLSRDEAEKNGREGGLASGETRRKNGYLRRAAQTLLQSSVTGNNRTVLLNTGCSEDELDNYSLVVFAIMQKALKGDVSAFNSLRDLIGENPTNKVEVEDINERWRAQVRYEYAMELLKKHDGHGVLTMDMDWINTGEGDLIISDEDKQ